MQPPKATRRADYRSKLAALAGFSALALLISWPLARHAGNQLPAAPILDLPFGRADLDLLVWILSWTARAVVIMPSGLFDANIFHPAGNALAASEHLIGLAPLATPLWFATGNPVLTYNLTALGVTVATAWTLWLAIREAEPAPVAAFVAAALFAFDPAVTSSWTRLHDSAIWLFPLIFLLAFRAARRPTPALLALLTATTALQILAGAYTAFLLATFMAALVPALLIDARRSGRSGLWPLASLALGALLAAPSALPYLGLTSSPDLADAVQQAPSLPLSFELAARSLLSGSGILLLPAAVVGLVRGRTRLPVRLSLLLAALVSLLLATGPQGSLVPGTDLPSLFSILVDTVPGFAMLRAPTRFLLVARLSIALLAGYGLGVLVGRLLTTPLFLRTAAVSSAAAFLVLVQPIWPLPLTEPLRTPYTTGAHRWLAENGARGAVLDLPAATSPAAQLAATGRAMLGATEHWLPLLNGYSGYPPPSLDLLMTLADRLPEPEAFAELCRYTDLRWIVAHFGLMPGRQAAFDASALPLVARARFGRDVVYEVTTTCGADKQKLLDSLRYPDDRSLRRISLEILPPSGRLGQVEVVPLQRGERGFLQPFAVRITNLGDSPWPGLEVRRSGRVEIGLRLLDTAGGAPKELATIPLGRDLAPGETFETAISPGPAMAKLTAGERIEIGLRQRGLGWFADHGGRGTARVVLDAENASSAPTP